MELDVHRRNLRSMDPRDWSGRKHGNGDHSMPGPRMLMTKVKTVTEGDAQSDRRCGSDSAKGHGLGIGSILRRAECQSGRSRCSQRTEGRAGGMIVRSRWHTCKIRERHGVCCIRCNRKRGEIVPESQGSSSPTRISGRLAHPRHVRMFPRVDACSVQFGAATTTPFRCE